MQCSLQTDIQGQELTPKQDVVVHHYLGFLETDLPDPASTVEALTCLSAATAETEINLSYNGNVNSHNLSKVTNPTSIRSWMGICKIFRVIGGL